MTLSGVVLALVSSWFAFSPGDYVSRDEFNPAEYARLSDLPNLVNLYSPFNKDQGILARIEADVGDIKTRMRALERQIPTRP